MNRESEQTKGVFPRAPTKPSTAREVNPRVRVFARNTVDMVGVTRKVAHPAHSS